MMCICCIISWLKKPKSQGFPLFPGIEFLLPAKPQLFISRVVPASDTQRKETPGKA